MSSDEFMHSLAAHLGAPGLVRKSEFQEFCLNTYDRLTVEQAAEEWERREA